MVTAVENKERLYLGLCVLFQLLILAGMNYLAYQPYGQVMRALQVRGFIKPGDRPTLAQVLMYFVKLPYTTLVSITNGSCCSCSSKVAALAEEIQDGDNRHTTSRGGGGDESTLPLTPPGHKTSATAMLT